MYSKLICLYTGITATLTIYFDPIKPEHIILMRPWHWWRKMYTSSNRLPTLQTYFWGILTQNVYEKERQARKQHLYIYWDFFFICLMIYASPIMLIMDFFKFHSFFAFFAFSYGLDFTWSWILFELFKVRVVRANNES